MSETQRFVAPMEFPIDVSRLWSLRRFKTSSKRQTQDSATYDLSSQDGFEEGHTRDPVQTVFRLFQAKFRLGSELSWKLLVIPTLTCCGPTLEEESNFL
ncbi:uncharacterized [Tachysurus ichikawai]